MSNPISRRLRAITQVPEMLPNGFRTRSEQLPYAKPPRWMTWIWIAAAALTAVVLCATLMGPMDESVLATGVVRPADYALVFPQVGGAVAEVSATPGMHVTAGQVLARLDTLDLDQERTILDAELSQAQADEAIAGAQLTATREAPLGPDLLFQARSVPHQEQVLVLRRDLLKRMEGLGDSNNISVLELTRERLNVQAANLDLERSRQAAALLGGGYAQAQVAAAEARQRAAAAHVVALTARRELLEREFAQRVVRAPADGLVVSRAVRYPGEKVDLGTALFKLAYGSGTQLRLYASEDRVNRIKPGMTVRFRTRSDPDRLTPMSFGKVEEVALDRDLTKEDTDRPDRRGSYAVDVAVGADVATLPLGAEVDAEIVLGVRPFWHLLLFKKEAAKP